MRLVGEVEFGSCPLMRKSETPTPVQPPLGHKAELPIWIMTDGEKLLATSIVVLVRPAPMICVWLGRTHVAEMMMFPGPNKMVEGRGVVMPFHGELAQLIEVLVELSPRASMTAALPEGIALKALPSVAQ